MVALGACASPESTLHTEPVTMPEATNGSAQSDESSEVSMNELGRNGTIGHDTTPTGPGPAIRLATPQIRGRVNPDDITAVVEGHLGEVSSCFGDSGTNSVSIRLIVSPTGSVQNAVPESGGTPVSDCVAGAVRRWNFTPPTEGGIGILLLTFEAIQ